MKPKKAEWRAGEHAQCMPGIFAMMRKRKEERLGGAIEKRDDHQREGGSIFAA